MLRSVLHGSAWLITLSMAARPAAAQDSGAGREIYTKRCVWCHGERGLGDGPSAVGMLPRPRDFTIADYKIRSTPHGQLPTDEDLFRVVARGLPGTPMPAWEKILNEGEIRSVVSYLKSFSPRFEKEARGPIGPPPSSPGSVERGWEVFRKARCFMCHGEAGRGDGGITTALNFQWGLAYAARDFTRGWTFKGGHEPRDIYLRITGGLNGTPMGPYRDLLSDQERWDLAHHVASLDREASDTSEDFVVAAIHTNDAIPNAFDAAPWETARPVVVPLAGQIVVDPPLRWWIPTAGSATVRALWNDTEVGFLLEWNDPTGPDDAFLDSALIQFAALDGKPYFLFGDKEHPVDLWHWHTGNTVEEWTAAGSSAISVQPARFRVDASWSEGRWRAIFRRALAGKPDFKPGSFVPTLFSIRDGANGEIGNVRAISTWLYTTLERPRSARSWLLALVYVLGTVIAEVWILAKPKP